MMDEDAISVKR